MNGRSSPRIRLGAAIRHGGYREADHWIWCASPVLGEDGCFHLFASRIRKTVPFHPGWLFASEIVRAQSPSPQGPYVFGEVILGPRDQGFFDGRSAHNPCIRKVGTKFLLFYMGSTYAGNPVDVSQVEPGGDFYMETWARKRIGLAWADSVHGPWHRPSQPLLEPRVGQWDAIATTNPAPWILPNGAVRMIYKSRTVASGPRLLGLAGAAAWPGPYTAMMKRPLFPSQDLEDACLWHDGMRFRMILKDMSGAIGGEAGCLVEAWSHDAVSWDFPDPPMLHGKRILWDDGVAEHLGNFERPQLLFDRENRPTHLFAAVSRGGSGIGEAVETFSVCLPLC